MLAEIKHNGESRKIRKSERKALTKFPSITLPFCFSKSLLDPNGIPHPPSQTTSYTKPNSQLSHNNNQKSDLRKKILSLAKPRTPIGVKSIEKTRTTRT